MTIRDDMGSQNVSVEYLSAGANRQTAVADWSRSGLLAFGADTNVAIWAPKVRYNSGLNAAGHLQKSSNLTKICRRMLKEVSQTF